MSRKPVGLTGLPLTQEEREEMAGEIVTTDYMLAFEARLDRRFEAIDRRFEAIETRLDKIEKTLETLRPITAITENSYRMAMIVAGFCIAIGGAFIYMDARFAPRGDYALRGDYASNAALLDLQKTVYSRLIPPAKSDEKLPVPTTKP